MKLCMVSKLSLLLPLLLAFVMFSALAAIPKPDSAKADAPLVKEKMVIPWPSGEVWSGGQVTQKPPTELFFPKGQSGSNWTEMVSTEFHAGRMNVNLPGQARLNFLGTQKASPNATWEIIGKGWKDEVNSEYPYIGIEIKCPDFLTKEPPQYQIWQFIQGHSGFFIVQYSYRGESMPDTRKDAIVAMFSKVRIEKVK